MLKAALLSLLMVTPAAASTLTLTVKGEANGTITIALADKQAPNHVARITELANSGQYDGVAFHRVIEGFMAQTGDVEFGKPGADASKAGRGGSSLPDLKAEFSSLPFDRGTVGMARSSDPNSANSQFFIMFAPAPHLDGQYTVVGKVTSGLDVLDEIKRGTGDNGEISGEPDRIVSAKVTP